MSEENQNQNQYVIHLCLHCGSQCSGKFCSDCSTIEKRKAMDEANRKNFEEHKLPPYHCDFCEVEAK